MFAASGYGLLAVSYRGYGGSTGSPTQTSLMRDGEAAYREALARDMTTIALFWANPWERAGITVLACKHPKSYEKFYGALLIISLGALAGGTFWDLSHGAGYSRFVVIAVIIYFSFLRALPVILARDKSVKEGDD
jgi:hypothetical protein